jgi:ATP-binding protein involved in chromosome partitioning
MKVPSAIKRDPQQGLFITWNSGEVSLMTREVLRKECPCAECKMKRGEDTHSSPLTPKKSLLKVVEHTSEQALTLERIWMVGNYALGIAWGDGHDSGIYTFDYLAQLDGDTHLHQNQP